MDVDVRSFREPDCDTDHYLVVEEFRARLEVSKQTAQKFDMEKFNLKKLNKTDGKEEYQVEISNRTASLEILDDHVDINRTRKLLQRESKFQPAKLLQGV